MSQRTQFANFDGHEIPFNDSIGDLQYLSECENRWALAFEENNLKNLYNATMLYYIALKTRAKFDGIKIYQDLKEIEIKIYTIDRNGDGQISPMERQRSAEAFGYCRENLMRLYMELAEIKVDSGWTLKMEKEKRPVTPAMEKLINDYLPNSKEILKKLLAFETTGDFRGVDT